MLSQASASTSSALLERKIEEATAGLLTSITRQLLSISENNSSIIAKYIETMKTEVNPSDHYRRDMIAILCRFQSIIITNPSKKYRAMIL
jgi:hypothetical protein